MVFVALGVNALESEKILIQNATVITASDSQVLENTDLLIESGLIAAIGSDLVADDAIQIDASNQIVTPGLIAPHSQLGLMEIQLERETRDDSTKTQVMCKQNIPLVTTETTNDFWKGISACGCDWTTKHSTANFDSAEYREGDYKWCFAPDSTHPSHKHNCENKTKHSMCRLNQKGHCISRYQVPKAEDQGTSKAFTNKVLKVKDVYFFGS